SSAAATLVRAFVVGQLTALVVLLVLQNFVLDAAELKAWGWRIPFFIGCVMIPFLFVIRHTPTNTVLFAGRFEKP
ncbi:MAG: hypothetical protein ABGY75_18085, partial [Gemmataceae bacterium]